MDTPTGTTAREAQREWQAQRQVHELQLSMLKEQQAELKAQESKFAFYGVTDPASKDAAATLAPKIEALQKEIQQHQLALAHIDQVLADTSVLVKHEALAAAEQELHDLKKREAEIGEAQLVSRKTYADLCEEQRALSPKISAAFAEVNRLRRELGLEAPAATRLGTPARVMAPGAIQGD